jgi:hypothetical protein
LDERQTWLTQRNSLASLERVETVARTRLGLGLPLKEQTVFIVEASDKSRELAGVWPIPLAWWERGAAFWRAVTGAKASVVKEARFGG